MKRTRRGTSKFATLALFLLQLVPSARAQQQSSAPPPKRLAIRAGHLIDGKSDTPIANALILIEDDKIVSVTVGGVGAAGGGVIGTCHTTRVARLLERAP